MDYAQRVAERSLPQDGDAVHKLVGDIQSMVDALCEIRQDGKVSIVVGPSSFNGGSFFINYCFALFVLI